MRCIVIYANYKKVFFPKLLEDPKVSPEDKVKIKRIIKETLESIYEETFSINRKIPNIKGECIKTICWLVYGFKHASEIHSLFWK